MIRDPAHSDRGFWLAISRLSVNDKSPSVNRHCVCELTELSGSAVRVLCEKQQARSQPLGQRNLQRDALLADFRPPVGRIPEIGFARHGLAILQRRS
jgi:hypothetical protein